MGNMKEDIVQIETTLTLQEISARLSRAKEDLSATVENAGPDPLRYVNPDMVVRFTGKNFFFGPREWCVVVHVVDKGQSREITLNALGSGVGAKVSSGFDMYRGEKTSFYQLKDSVARRNRIIKLLEG